MSIYRDEDNDGKLNSFFGIPTEEMGISNNPKGGFELATTLRGQRCVRLVSQRGQRRTKRVAAVSDNPDLADRRRPHILPKQLCCILERETALD